MSIKSETTAELQQIKEKLSDKSSVNAAYVAMNNKISDPSTTEALLAEIQDLFDRSLAMADSFERIRVELGVVDAQNYTDGNGKPLGKLQPTWVGFQDVCSRMDIHPTSGTCAPDMPFSDSKPCCGGHANLPQTLYQFYEVLTLVYFCHPLADHLFRVYPSTHSNNS